MKKNRIVNRYYSAILYKDDKNYKKYFNNILNNYLEVTWIEHDKDINENGETKKPHIHVLFKVGENARHLSSISKETEIPENYLQGCNKKAMLMYLIHLNNIDKTQYDVEQVQGELKTELVKILLKKEPEENKIQMILDKINQGSIKSTTELLQHAIDYQCLDEIKKAQYLLCKIIDEKKRKYYRI